MFCFLIWNGDYIGIHFIIFFQIAYLYFHVIIFNVSYDKIF